MEFCLHYYGKLKSQDGAGGKHQIRQMLHSQILGLCASDPFHLVFKGDPEGTRKDSEKPMYVEIAGKRFWFLVCEHLRTVVDLKITMLVPHKVGAIVHNGGDVDNRIKTLFDALRVPSAESEIPKADNFDYSAAGGMYCLLQDDKLISKIDIASYQDFSPNADDSVRCLIEVKTRITAALWGNLYFV